jgi:glycosyltransferase 2 family protein
MPRLAGVVVGVTISIVAAVLLALSVDVGEIAASLAAADARWLLPAVATLAFQAALRALRWSRVLAAMGQRTGLIRTLEPMLIGYLVNAVLPGRLGEVVRATTLAARERIAFGTVAASVLVERGADLMAILALSSLALGLAGSPTAMLLGGFAAMVAGVLLAARWAGGILRFVPSFTPSALRRVLGDFARSVARVPARSLVLVVALSAAAWLFDTALAWLAGRALGVELPLHAAAALGLGAALGTAVPAAPGYLATYELGAVTFGGLVGVEPGTALAIAVLTHLVGVGSLALAGGLSAGRLGTKLSLARLPNGVSLLDSANDSRP